MTVSLFAVAAEPVPGSVLLVAKAATECRRQGLCDIPVSPIELRSVRKWLIRRTQAAILALADCGGSKRAVSKVTSDYVTDVVGFCRNVKLGTAVLGLD